MRIILLISIIVCAGCGRFASSPYEVAPRHGHENLNARGIAAIQTTATDTLRIAVIGDTHRFYRATEKVIERINAIDDICFVIHTGDLVDFGLQNEYTRMQDMLSRLRYPLVVVVGNHDLIANGGKIYQEMYGEFDFRFTIGGHRFVFLNTNGREYGFDGAVPDLAWLDRALSDTLDYHDAVVVSHVPSDSEDFDESLREPFAAAIRRYGKVLLTLNGHDHSFALNQPFGDGITQVTSYSTEKKRFMLLDIWEGGFSIDTTR